jgi:hypothetical protein
MDDLELIHRRKYPDKLSRRCVLAGRRERYTCDTERTAGKLIGDAKAIDPASIRAVPFRRALVCSAGSEAKLAMDS